MTTTTTITQGPLTLHWSRALVRAIVALVSALVALGLLSATANATPTVWVTAGSYPGSATTPPVLIRGANSTWSGTDLIFEIGGPFLDTRSRTVRENPTYGAYYQWVTVKHRLLTWNKPYYDYATGRMIQARWTVGSTCTSTAAYISPSATSLKDPGCTFNTQMYSVNTNLSYDVVITWKRSNGSVLGQKVYGYTSAADYLIRSDAGLHSAGILTGRWSFMP